MFSWYYVLEHPSKMQCNGLVQAHQLQLAIKCCSHFHQERAEGEKPCVGAAAYVCVFFVLVNKSTNLLKATTASVLHPAAKAAILTIGVRSGIHVTVQRPYQVV